MAQHRGRSVRLWLPLLPAAAAVLLLALVIWLVERTVGDELERRAEQRVEQASAVYADQVSRVLARRAAELNLIAAMPALGMDLVALRQQLDNLKRSSPAYPQPRSWSARFRAGPGSSASGSRPPANTTMEAGLNKGWRKCFSMVDLRRKNQSAPIRTLTCAAALRARGLIT